MAKFGFYLKQPKSIVDTAIYLNVHYDKRNARIFIGESINPDQWDKRLRRVKEKSPWMIKMNRRLAGIENLAKDLFEKYLEEHEGEKPRHKDFETIIKDALNGNSRSNRVDLFSFFQAVIDEKLAQLKIKNRGYRESSVPSYVNSLNALKSYAKDKKKDLDFQDITSDFYHAFNAYMENELDLAYNTRGNRMKYIRAVLRKAKASGIKVPISLDDWKGFSVDSEGIAFTLHELDVLSKLKLEGTLDRVRDLFIVSCWTGLRHSDFNRIEKVDVKNNMLHIQTKKTGHRVVIPLSSQVQKVFEKYDELPRYSLQKFNKYVKDLGAVLAAELYPDLSNQDEATIQRALFIINKLTSKTGRRTFCTVMYYKKVPIDTIRAISAHKTESAFLTYLRVAPEEHARNLERYLD
jgi:site-specific recombinase XerD